jgi:serine/threonine protein kinase
MPVMDSIPSEPRTAAASPWRESREPGQAGTAVGHYVLGRCIGSGGMARVYEARHRFLGHRVAIKLLYPEHCTDRHLVRRFCNEGRAAAAVEHPGLVRYFDVGRTPEGDVYLVMELLVGESLHRRLMRGPLSEAAAVAIGRQIASALAASHAHGLVHRDVKPENVFLMLDPEVPGGERVKVLDFGIAKRTLRADTSPGIVVGTPAYMAPEQCQPDLPLDGRADIYGLGALLHRMVTGRPLFESASDVGLMCRQVHDAPASPRSLGITVSDAFERLLATCLAKNPGDRFPSMAALADTLAALATGGNPRVKDTEIMTAQSVPDLDVHFAAAPMYPVCDPSPPGGVMADGTPPPWMWTQSQPGGLSGALRRWGLLGRARAALPRSRARTLYVQRAGTSVRTRPRPWIVLGGLALTVLTIAMAALSW